MKLRGFFIFICFLNIQLTKGQCPTVDFSLPSNACTRENIQLVNSSQPGSFLWDFCSGDFNNVPSSQTVYTLSAAVGRPAMEFAKDGEKWFAFVTGTWTNTLYRVEYHNGISNSPTFIHNLGNVGEKLNGPGSIRIINQSGKWFALIHNTTNGELLKLSFGNSLSNSIEQISTLATGIGSTNNGMSIGYDNIEGWVCIISTTSNQFQLLRLGTDLTVAIPADILTTVAVPDQNNLGDIDLVKQCDQWFGYANNFGNGNVYRLSFGSNLFQQPVIDQITSLGAINGGRLRVMKEGEDYFLAITSLEGSFYKVSLGLNLSIINPIVENEGNFGSVLQNSYGLAVVKDSSFWNISVVDQSSGKVSTVNYSFECQFSEVLSDPDSPIINYTQPGNYIVDLTLTTAAGISSSVTKPITVSGLIASSIEFVSSNICINNDVNFTSTNSSQDVTTYYWSFGDSQTSTDPNPAHQYSSAGEYSVQLNVTADNGCNNYTEKTIKIYDPPTSAFDLPPGLICTNNEFIFTNNTIDNFDGNLTYEWLVNDIQKSTERDFNYAFASEGDQQIKLKTSIPGCSDELTQTLLNVQTGPVVGFSYLGKCEDEEIRFTNESAGFINGYQWNFGNGNTSTQQNPSEIFADYGKYSVSLITTGTNGCASTITKPVNIYSVPQTNFSLDLPPFACSGSLSQFNDLTPPMPDSNIASWAWSFGDQSNGSSSQKNPLYTYLQAGDYPVSLTTTTNYGCSNSVQKSVTIYPSPKADFSFGPACVNQGTQFRDLSMGDIKSWLWSIQSNTYSVKDPVHIFKTAVTHQTLLTVTGTNNCINQVSKNVIVPVPVVADFTVQSTCATKPAVFDEINKGGTDRAVSWKWDFAGQGSSSVSPAQYVFTTTGNKSVTMSTTRESGCIYSVTKTIPIIDPPKAQFTVFLDAGAAPFPVDFVNTSQRASTFTWKFGDGSNPNYEFSPSHTYTQLGSYTAVLTAGNSVGCEDSFSQLINVVVPQINAAISDFKLQKIPGNNNWSSVVTISNKSNVALIDPEVYLDISGNALISEKVIGVIKPNEVLNYTFTTSIAPRAVDFACAEINVNADDYLFDNRQCVNVAEEFISMIPYPNPANDELILEWINISSEPMEVIIYNASGKAIISRQYSPTLKGLNQVKLDVSGLQMGIYFVSYSVNGKVQNFKFSVAR